MEIEKGHIFNLWNTNGRRSDILNALSIYLNILKEMTEEGNFDEWNSFPKSLTQFSFYQKAISKSPEVFQTHTIYDRFIENIKLDIAGLFERNKLIKTLTNKPQLIDDLDSAIEARARHYSSNLVKFGFTTAARIITPAGQTYINEKIVKDPLEKLLPLNDINIILLRQLVKLRIYSKNLDGKRYYYSPFFNALNLLLCNETINKDDFIYIVQGINPYLNKLNILSNLRDQNYKKLLDELIQFKIKIPVLFSSQSKVSQDDFNKEIKNRKTKKVVPEYYSFYSALFDYVENKNEETYNQLLEVLKRSNKKIKKAFCLGKSIFNFGPNFIYSFSEFEEKNKDNPYFLELPTKFNTLFFEMYEKSKYLDGIAEYSDTTMRVLSACGLFKFKKTPELSNRRLLSIIFSKTNLIDNIMGTSTEEEFKLYEEVECSFFGSNKSLCEILNLSENDIKEIFETLAIEYKTIDEELIKKQIDNKTSLDFRSYIKDSYPKERIIELLELFSNRGNDSKIKKQVNDSATVPTIYEFIVGIAWYYISGEDFDLYHALNLTLNADFEPEMHAGGGVGDIVIDYDNMSIMLEATLMNEAAQRRGEWEPVLRHSLNNQALNMEKEVYTFFIANSFDFNTTNIWRAVAAAPLRSTSGDEKDIDGVIIMPFTNENIIHFLKTNVSSSAIIKVVKESFMTVPKISKANWHQEIIEKL